MKWKMKNGGEIEIKKMTDSNLLNSIRALRRNGYVGVKEHSDSLVGILSYHPSGDAACDVVDQLINEVSSEIPIKGMDELLREMKKRKLEELEL